ncbi:MAG TPA: hypothetical protein VFB76_09200 [Candidatus Angelobacter sp.]|nr:hypothetical protein [Candidatus Angelobacter sp.]
MNWTDIPALWLAHYPVLCFVLACIVSTFTSDIRHFFTVQPLNLRMRLLKTRLASIEERLAWLRKMNENSAQLIAYFSLRAFNVMICLVIMLVLTFLEVFDLTKTHHITFLMLAMFIAAFQITPATRHAFDLTHFDKVVPALESQSQQLRQKIDSQRG